VGEKRRVKRIRITPTLSNRPIVVNERPFESKILKVAPFSIRFGQRSNMGRRFVSALLSILITCLKFVVNMLTIGISFLTKKNIPLVEDLFDMSDERTEAIERRKYVARVEHSQYDSPIKY